MFGQKIFANIISRRTGQLAADFHRTVAGGQFGPAAFAGPKTRHFRRRRMAEKPAVLLQGRFHPAKGTAINMGRLDGDKKASVKTGVPRQYCLIALVRI